MDKVLIVDKIDKETYKLAKKNNCVHVVSLSNEHIVNTSDINIVNTSHLDMEASWIGWREVENIVNKIEDSIPNIFTFQDLDLKRAGKKQMWWLFGNKKGRIIKYSEYFKHNNIDVMVYSKYKLSSEIQQNISDLKKRKYKRIYDNIKSLYLTFSPLTHIGAMVNKVDAIKKMGGIIIPVIGINQIELYNKLIKLYNYKNIQFTVGIPRPVQNYDNIISVMKQYNYPYSVISPQFNSIFSLRRLQYYDLLRRKSKVIRQMVGEYEGYVLQNVVLSLLNVYRDYKYLCSSLKPEVIVTTAFEIDATADILMQVAGNSGCKVINLMNGMKYPLPNNRDIEFDTWCIWSESQRKMLKEVVGVPEKQFKIAGHLRADTAMQYQYQGSLDDYKAHIKNKYILSVFSQPQEFPGNYRNRFFNTIREFIKCNEDYVAIIKPHPRENKNDIAKVIGNCDRIIILEHTHKEPQKQLYDLLKLTDVTVVISSTVAYESLFFQKPVISLNYTGIKNILPVNDNKMVLEVNATNEFSKCVERFIQGNKNELSRDLEYYIGYLDGENNNRVKYIIDNYLKERDKEVQ